MEQKAMSIAEINQLQGCYEKVVEQNKDLQRDLNAKKQELNELSAGVLMIAEILGLEVPHKATANDMISQIAANLEEVVGLEVQHNQEDEQ